MTGLDLLTLVIRAEGGALGAKVLDGQNIGVSALSFGGTATAFFSTFNDGQTDGNQGGPDWYDPLTASIGSDYEIRGTQQSGDPLTSGTLGSWLLMNVTRTWELEQTVLGTSNAVVQFEIRDTATQTVQATFTVTFAAEVA